MIDVSGNVYIAGDPHFSASQPWRKPIGDRFLDWLENEFKPEPNSYFIGLGDNSDDAVNPGSVISQLERFATILQAKFKHSYMLVGNHDLKLYKYKPHLAFDFLDQKEGITILKDPAQILNIGGLKVLAMPHYNYRPEYPSMYDYYNNLPSNILNQEYDLMVGHFADETNPMIHDQYVKTKKIKAKHIALGHIHSRVSDHYLGSIAPFKVSEDDRDPNIPARALWVLNKENDEVVKSEIPLPVICKYRFINYPDPLPDTPEPVTVWTVNNCNVETVAKNYYQEASGGQKIYIRGVVSKLMKKDYNKVSTKSDSVTKITKQTDRQVLEDWLKESKIRVSRAVVKKLRNLLPEESVPQK